MIAVRPSDARGRSFHGWLDSRHTFSFAGYHDRAFMGFRALRVLNEDRVDGGRGFPTHGHREMEIVSYVIEGALRHEDSMRNGSVLRPGDVQRMSAGRGVYHSEENASRSEGVHFLQIWIVPDTAGLTPSYAQAHWDEPSRRGRLALVGSRDGREGSIVVHQDVAMYASLLAAGDRVTHALAAGRHAWLQVIRGTVTANGTALRGGDGAAVSDEGALAIEAATPTELVLFDLA